jgi:CDGSH-type Zn-finger protein
MSPEKPRIACLPNGPYYLLNDLSPRAIPNIQTSNGEPCISITGVALCRCGGSNNKPFCDGTHGKNGFSDTNRADATRNKREDYAGKTITIHDNRGICAHAGYCTDTLSSVFRLGQVPWIDPDGATTQDIIRTIQKCPSGALSYSVDSVEHRDQDREPMVTVTKNGPYAVTGGIELVDTPFGAGASTEHYTLCRCGGSNNKPFCDGTHWRIGFSDEKN